MKRLKLPILFLLLLSILAGNHLRAQGGAGCPATVAFFYFGQTVNGQTTGVTYKPDNTVVLKWITNTENNVKEYIVEKATNQAFYPIGKVPAVGTLLQINRINSKTTSPAMV